MTGEREGDDQPWPDEPAEPATGEPSEEELENIGPGIPEVEIPQAPDPPEPAATDVPDHLARQFWKLVAIFNLALFALALGPLLVVFRGEYQNGGAVFLLGLGAFAYGYVRYRRVTSDDHNG